MVANRRNHQAVARVGRALLASAGSVLLLLASGREATAQPPGAGQPRTLRGTVERFTTAKKGEVDGCILNDGTWVHWPPHLADRVSPLLAKGDRVRVTGRTEIGKKGESKFEAELIVNLRTDRAIALDEDGPGPGPKGPKGKGKGKRKGKGPREEVGEVTVLRGTVERFTTAPKGEVDGFMLDDGTWVHWPPHLAERVKGVLNKGDRVRVSGSRRTGKKGETKFEAQSITNLRNDKSVLFDDRPGESRAAPAGEGREERLRALERRLEDLTREIRDLRRTR